MISAVLLALCAAAVPARADDRERAAALLEDGHYEESARLLRRILEKEPSASDRGVLNHELFDDDLALGRFQEASADLAKGKDDPGPLLDYYVMEGYARLNSGDDSAARAAFARGAARDPVESYKHWGSYYLGRGDPARAAACLRKFLALAERDSRVSPTSVLDARGLLTVALFKQGRLEEAEKSARLTVDACGRFARQDEYLPASMKALSRAVLAEIAASRGHRAGAETILARALADCRAPGPCAARSTTLASLASVYADEGKRDQALAAAKEADALYSLGRAWMRAYVAQDVLTLRDPGEVYARLGRSDLAARFYGDVLAGRRGPPSERVKKNASERLAALRRR